MYRIEIAAESGDPDLLCAGQQRSAVQRRDPPGCADLPGRRVSVLFRPGSRAGGAGLSGAGLQRLCAALHHRAGLPAGPFSAGRPGRAAVSARQRGGAAHRPPQDRCHRVFGRRTSGGGAGDAERGKARRHGAGICGYAGQHLGAGWSATGAGPGRPGDRFHPARLYLCHPGGYAGPSQEQPGLCRCAG